MSHIGIVTSKALIAGGSWRARDLLPSGRGRHQYRAKMNGRSIAVTLDGNPVEVRYAGTTDNRTVTAYVEGVGYIGGWEYPSPRRPWSDLVIEINKGILHYQSSTLPKSNRISGDDMRAIIECANDVIENWSAGDLAGAVNALEEALVDAGKRRG